MKFKTWQKIRIRERLQMYREKESEEDGDLLPLAHVQARLEEFFMPEMVKVSMRSQWTVKYEPLRRFACGPTPPSDLKPEKARPNFLPDRWLRMLADFLIAEDYMTEDDLRPKALLMDGILSSYELDRIMQEWSYERIISQWDSIMPESPKILERFIKLHAGGMSTKLVRYIVSGNLQIKRGSVIARRYRDAGLRPPFI